MGLEFFLKRVQQDVLHGQGIIPPPTSLSIETLFPVGWPDLTLGQADIPVEE